MAIAARYDNSQAIADINTTPLIDVMLVLLTLLIITLPIQTHVVTLDMPTTPGPQVPIVTLDIDFQGGLAWNGRPVDRSTLDADLANAAHQVPQPEIHIRPDRLTHYDIVAKVLADAQRLGATRVGIVGDERYAQ